MHLSRRGALVSFAILATYLVCAALVWNWFGPAPRYVLPAGRLWHGCSADGRHLITVGGGCEHVGPGLTQVRAGPVEIWDLRTGDLVASVFEPDKPLCFAVLSPDGRRLAVRDGLFDKPGQLLLYKIPTGEFDGLLAIPREAQGFSVSFSPDGRTLAVDTGTTGKPEVTLRDLDGERPPLLIPGVRASFAFSPDGRLLAATGSIQESGKEKAADVRLVEVATGRLLATLPPGASPGTTVTSLFFSPTGAFLVYDLYRRKPSGVNLFAWDVAQRRLVAERERLSPMSFLEDGKTVVACGQVGATRTETGFVMLDLAHGTSRTVPIPSDAYTPSHLGHGPQPPLLLSAQLRQFPLPLSLHEWMSAWGLSAMSRQAINTTTEVRSAETGELLANYHRTGYTGVFLTSDPSAALIHSAAHIGDTGRLELWDFPPRSTLVRQVAAMVALAAAFAGAIWLVIRRRGRRLKASQRGETMA